MAHDEKSAHDPHHDELAHPMPVSMLIGVWAVLMFFTVLTVWAAQQGLGSQTSFIVAMIIATIKAGLVMSIFMHLWWDKRMNLFTFLGSFLFVMLFIGMALTDKSEYNHDIISKMESDSAQAQTSTGAPTMPSTK
ncbi:MAG TPA: cytochrome C oxidase subunit IV family protein [Polyangiaceae bacterium]|jgi:cytochrome c oxidase subunit 4|nr:cytochrome C oxidase subunit IV family protein [Polyangiaceae bacterium]